jgi:phosphoglycolate phosphatase-like HAD superfamily hydrolase
LTTAIFDFDQTIADTSMLEPYRKARNWSLARSNIRLITPYGSILKILSALKARRMKLGIVTTSPKNYCETGLRHLGIMADAVIGYHDVIQRKPSPEAILLALQRLQSSAHDTVGFGDHANDIIAYNEAGVRSVACLWGCDNHEAIRAANPVHIIDSPDQINTLLNF